MNDWRERMMGNLPSIIVANIVKASSNMSLKRSFIKKTVTWSNVVNAEKSGSFSCV